MILSCWTPCYGSLECTCFPAFLGRKISGYLFLRPSWALCYLDFFYTGGAKGERGAWLPCWATIEARSRQLSRALRDGMIETEGASGIVKYLDLEENGL